ncbi:MAG: hypothetical protein U5K99_07630 [Anaerolineales bacterium]|nr:hypothetical protein [Anaerolineales bacterium]
MMAGEDTKFQRMVKIFFSVVLVGTITISLIITFLGWDPAYTGIFLNLVILVSLFVDLQINQKMLNQFVTSGQK